MSRPRGGFIGHNPAPAASAVNSAAGGIWTLREAEALKRAGTWPSIFIDPTSISGLQLWLDASDASTLYDATTGGSLVAADGTVKRWEDKSGNNRHATEATNGPQRKTAVQGGLDVLRFDGSNDSLAIASSTATFKFLHSADSTVFITCKAGTTADPGVIYMLLATYSTASAQTGYALRTNDSSQNDALIAAISRGVSGSFVVVHSSSDDIFPSNTFGVVSNVLKPTNATAAQRSLLRVNGGSPDAANASTNQVSTSNSEADLTIGKTPVLDSSPLNGDIAEIIIYDSALSDANRTLVENYLIAKWGIT